MFSAQILNRIGRTPILGRVLRHLARHYPEGSVVTIRSGRAKGMKWRRYHRFVNGYWLGTYELALQEAIWDSSSHVGKQRLSLPGLPP